MDKLLPYSLQSSTVYAGHFYYYIYKYSRKEVGGMLEQLKQLEPILTQVMSNIQLIIGVLLFIAVVLEFVHIRQTSRINKKLSYAGRWLQRYLNAVFNEDSNSEPEEDETEETAALREQRDLPRAEQENIQRRDDIEPAELAVSQPLKSRQEENMRLSLAHKKQRKDEELLDTVLQEIFD